jgi:hypothetical protein
MLSLDAQDATKAKLASYKPFSTTPDCNCCKEAS